MLKKTEPYVQEALDLADFIEKLPEEKYHQCSTTCCIAGWQSVRLGLAKTDFEAAARSLGLVSSTHSIIDCNSQYLFYGYPLVGRFPTNKEAAKVLRHLALTRIIDWSIVGKASQPPIKV